MQFEFGCLLGPADGRYLVRPTADAAPRAVIVLGTFGARQRRRLRRRLRGGEDSSNEAPVPTSRATVIRADPFDTVEEAEHWLAGVRRDRERLDTEIEDAVRELNGLLRAQRAAASDPFVRDVRPAGANAVRVGHGSGELVADGRFDAAFDVPPERRRRRRAARLAPEERLAGILGGREPLLAADELVLRARSDLAAGRPREAALQARVALECVLEETSPEAAGDLHGELRRSHGAIGEAAAAAVVGDPPEPLRRQVEETVRVMETALRRHRQKRS